MSVHICSNLACEIRREVAEDAIWIERLLDDVMGPTRRVRGVYQLRTPGDLDLGMSFTARCGQNYIASIRFWPVPGAPQSRLLGPLVVDPDYQRGGIGTALVAAGLRATAEGGIAQIFVVGDPSFYRRFGFQSVTSVIDWLPEPYDRARVLVWTRRSTDPTSIGEKVWVRWCCCRRLSAPRATNSKRPGQGRELTQATAA